MGHFFGWKNFIHVQKKINKKGQRKQYKTKQNKTFVLMSLLISLAAVLMIALLCASSSLPWLLKYDLKDLRCIFLISQYYGHLHLPQYILSLRIAPSISV